MRRIIYYVAASADGYIARPDGDVAWLERPKGSGDYGMAAFFKTIDTVLMGRKTWDVAKSFGQEGYPGVRNVVFTRRRRAAGAAKVEFARGDVRRFARSLRAGRGKDVWLCGGGELAAAFLDAGALDEIVVHVIPTLIGKGIPFFGTSRREVPLRLLSSRVFKDGLVRLRYAVGGPKPARTARRAR